MIQKNCWLHFWYLSLQQQLTENRPIAWPYCMGHTHLAVCLGWCSLILSLSINCQHQRMSFGFLMTSGPRNWYFPHFPGSYSYFPCVFVSFHVEPSQLWKNTYADIIIQHIIDMQYSGSHVAGTIQVPWLHKVWWNFVLVHHTLATIEALPMVTWLPYVP